MKYRCWIPENGDEVDGRDVDAVDEESAACEYVNWHESNCAEYQVAEGGEMVVSVRTSGSVESYSVSGEYVPSYRASACRDI